MSALCSFVHGNKKQQTSVGAAPEDSIPASSMVPEVSAEIPREPAPTPVAEVASPARASPVPPPVQQQTGPKFGQAYIKVVGCGGGGGNAISRMITAGLQVREQLLPYLFAAQVSAAWNCRNESLCPRLRLQLFSRHA